MIVHPSLEEEEVMVARYHRNYRRWQYMCYAKGGGRTTNKRRHFEGCFASKD